MKLITLFLILAGATACNHHCPPTQSYFYAKVGDCTVYRISSCGERDIFTTICPGGRAKTEASHQELRGKISVLVPDDVDTIRSR